MAPKAIIHASRMLVTHMTVIRFPRRRGRSTPKADVIAGPGRVVFVVRLTQHPEMRYAVSVEVAHRFYVHRGRQRCQHESLGHDGGSG